MRTVFSTLSIDLELAAHNGLSIRLTNDNFYQLVVQSTNEKTAKSLFARSQQCNRYFILKEALSNSIESLLGRDRSESNFPDHITTPPSDCEDLEDIIYFQLQYPEADSDEEIDQSIGGMEKIYATQFTKIMYTMMESLTQCWQHFIDKEGMRVKQYEHPPCDFTLKKDGVLRIPTLLGTLESSVGQLEHVQWQVRQLFEEDFSGYLCLTEKQAAKGVKLEAALGQLHATLGEIEMPDNQALTIFSKRSSMRLDK
jgi:hypothetical protein